jgi:hypothetical protein
LGYTKKCANIPLESWAFTSRNRANSILLVLFFVLAVNKKAIKSHETKTIIKLIKFSNDNDSICYGFLVNPVRINLPIPFE